MDNQEQYLLARQRLVLDIKKEILGGGEDGDLVVDSPVKRYSAGMLFPDGYENRNKDAKAETDADRDDESQPRA
jgi:hypothetical protein